MRVVRRNLAEYIALALVLAVTLIALAPSFYQKNERLYPEMYGAAGDGVTDDAAALNRCFAAADTYGAEVYLSGVTYLVESSVTPQGRVRIVSGGAILLAKAGGSYQQMYLGGAGTALGKYVILDMKHASYSTISGPLRIDGASIVNIVGLGASELGATPGGMYNSSIEHLRVTNCDIGVYGQGTTTAVAGSFTGCWFGFFHGEGNNVDMRMDQNQDDIAIGVYRTAGADTASMELGDRISVGSMFLQGGGAATYGVRLIAQGAGLTAKHLFIEGTYDDPISAASPYVIVTCQDVMVSSTFASTHDSLLDFATTKGLAELTLNWLSKDPLANVVSFQNYAAAARMVKLHYPFDFSLLAPATWIAGAVNSSDDQVEVWHQGGHATVTYESSASPFVRYKSGVTEDEVLDHTATTIAMSVPSTRLDANGGHINISLPDGVFEGQMQSIRRSDNTAARNVNVYTNPTALLYDSGGTPTFGNQVQFGGYGYAVLRWNQNKWIQIDESGVTNF